MFAVLEADGIDIAKLDFSKPGSCASKIFTALLRRVQARIPTSCLLYPISLSLDTARTERLIQDKGESKAAFRYRQRRSEAEGSFAKLKFLTLAHTPDNFQSALIHTMEGAVKMDSRDVMDVKGAVEGLMYRLAVKEPSAFPEVFAA